MRVLVASFAYWSEPVAGKFCHALAELKAKLSESPVSEVVFHVVLSFHPIILGLCESGKLRAKIEVRLLQLGFHDRLGFFLLYPRIMRVGK